MSGFKVADVVEPLDYNFGEHGPTGRIPEPSREALDAFWEGRRRILEEAGIDLAELETIDPLTVEGRVALTRAFTSIPEDKRKAMTPAQVENFARLCDGSPSKEELEALPARYQEAFFGWLMGKLSNPTQQNGTSD